jgi:hypothetical protein
MLLYGLGKRYKVVYIDSPKNGLVTEWTEGRFRYLVQNQKRQVQVSPSRRGGLPRIVKALPDGVLHARLHQLGASSIAKSMSMTESLEVSFELGK